MLLVVSLYIVVGAILATIVEGGWAIVVIYREAVEIN
jgi:hypothetical protein